MKRLVESQEEANVDCTLSLGTPSTRYRKTVSSEHRWSFGGAYSIPTDSSSSSCSCISISQSAWDILQIQVQQQQQSGRGIDGDSLVPRRCTNCDTTSTPLWRNGPRGPKSLCNACGIRYKKEERRSTVVEPPQHHHHLSPWSRYATPQGQETSSSMSHVLSADQLRLVHGDEDRDDDVGVPFLSWTCNPSPEFPWSQVSSMT